MKNDGFKIEADLEEYEDWNDNITMWRNDGRREKHKLIEKVVSAFL